MFVWTALVGYVYLISQTNNLNFYNNIMKNTRKNILIALSALILTSGMMSCEKKYEDGPAIALQSKKERVVNTWEIEKAISDGEEVTDNYDQYTLAMTKSGDAELEAEYTFVDFSYEYSTNGTWEFSNNKENLVLDFEDDDADAEYQILRLTKDELWLRERGGEDELHLMTK